MDNKGLPTEHDEQTAVVSWLQIAHPAALFWATPNGAHLSGGIGQRAAAMNKLKAEGFLAGVSDLIIFEPCGGYSALFVEMKRARGGVVHENQYWFIMQVEQRGALGMVAEGADEAIDFISKYLANKIIKP